MNIVKLHTNTDVNGPVTLSSPIKSLDTVIEENQSQPAVVDMKEFGFKLLYNDWMQQTLLSDGLTAEDQVEW
ncbi:hypothetical protein WN53_18345 [Serratia fonticola]|uniref:hypothetical protein n=1 Tax=Serratia fonticola TaxID=47917 RepID=UPI00040ED668|nr:hypothetical protein [Serratia fonticola]AKG70924.1 hypothetical protein WN53_18345 [Serratia fonticola]CAI1684859.1 Uncharacterised protein [Serratia fonticola]